MKLLESIKSFFKKISTFHIFLIAVSPILISFLIHMSVLIYANYVKWTWFGKGSAVEEPITVEIIGEGQKDDRLKFQGMDLEDNLDADDNMFDPVPEIEYKPVVPNVEILPDPKTNDALDIISVQAAAMKNKWVNPVTGGKPLDTGYDMMAGSFAKHIQSMREGGLDVVFVFDSTDSMWAYLNEVKLKIRNLAAALRKLVPTCRIGLVTYKDRKDEYVTEKFPLSYSIKPQQKFLDGIQNSGGYDIREAVAEGLRVAIDEMNWNKKSKKFILLIGDAPPYEEDVSRAVEMIKRFKENMGGRVSVIDIRKPKEITRYYWEHYIMPSMTDPGTESFEYLTSTQKVMDDFETFAHVGGGESARLTNEEKVIRHMLLLIFGTRWELYLNEFMSNL